MVAADKTDYLWLLSLNGCGYVEEGIAEVFSTLYHNVVKSIQYSMK